MRKLVATALTAVLALSGLPALAFADTASSEPTDLKPLEGKTISIMGDSISTYDGWSDKYPITDESCTNRYGEPYYGLPGSDHHNEELLVTDTWWHQAATELGAEVLVSNAGNSTGLLCASYPGDASWDLYLKEMLAWKSRPYYLGTADEDPDIIALYIGSNEVARATDSQFGSIDDVDFNTLITENTDGSFTYAEPTTVAEAYSILLHKVSVTYPNAEVYCFACVPSAGGDVNVINTRLPKAVKFNEMMRGVAAHYGAIVVELPDAFQIDPNNDGLATAEDVVFFKSCYYNDPHPNAAGFDVISECFVNTVLANSKKLNPGPYASVETKAGVVETVPLKVSQSTADGVTTMVYTAKNYVTEQGMTVNYNGSSSVNDNPNAITIKETESSYTSTNKSGTYQAEGGSESSTTRTLPHVTLSIPLTTDVAGTEPNEGLSIIKGDAAGPKEPTGDTSTDDGVYNYTTTDVIIQGIVSIETIGTNTASALSQTAFGSMKYVNNTTTATGDNGLVAKQYAGEVVPPSNPGIKDGFEFEYIGSDKLSRYWVAQLLTEQAKVVEPELTLYGPFYTGTDGTKLYSEYTEAALRGRNFIVPQLYLNFDEPIEGSWPAQYDSVQQFILVDKNGNTVTTYCADLLTPAVEGHDYKIENIENATYYSKDKAAMIRTIALNGYWGTDSGFGSLEALKQLMRDSNKFTDDEISRLNDGMALTATQYAIWHHSNSLSGRVFINCYYATTNTLSNGTDKIAPESDVALIFKLYRYLITLPPTTIDRATSDNTTIDSSNLIKAASLTITDKPEDVTANQDDDPTNDVYMVDLAIEFTVEPKAGNNDDLSVTVMNGDVVVAEGSIAGPLESGEVQLSPNDNNEYVFSDLMLQEGKDESLCISVIGTQNLVKGVYLFTPEHAADDEDHSIVAGCSQTMVGIAEGARSVNANFSLSFKLNVNEEVAKTEHVWRTEVEKLPETGGEEPPAIAPTGDKLISMITFAICAMIVSLVVIRKLQKEGVR